MKCKTCDYHFGPEGFFPVACPRCGKKAFESADPARAGLKLKIAMRHSYAQRHIRTAALFARNSGALEKEFGGPNTRFRFIDDNEAFVTSAVFSAAAFIECTINEFLSDIADGQDKAFRSLFGEDVERRISLLWGLGKKGLKWLPPVEKYEAALILCDKKSDWTETTFLNARWLIDLRNYLVHATSAETIPILSIGDDEEDSASRLANRLRNLFPPNQYFLRTGNPFFPDKCMGHGCAAWGVQSAVGFTDEFFGKLNMNPPYEKVREELETLWKDPNSDDGTSSD